MKLKNRIVSFLVFLAIFTILLSCGGSESNRGDTYFSQNQFEEAIAAYTQFLETRPTNVKALYNRGRAHEELGNFEEAESDFKKAHELDAKNIQILLSLSNLYQKMQKHQLALLYADYAVEIPGTPATAYFLKGRALHQLGNANEALREYSAAIKMNADYGQAFYYRGMLKIAMKNERGACQDFRSAMSLKYDRANEAAERYCN